MVVLGTNVVVMAMVDELVAGMVVAGLVVVPVATADITALQSTCWYLGCVLWSMRPSKGKR